MSFWILLPAASIAACLGFVVSGIVFSRRYDRLADQMMGKDMEISVLTAERDDARASNRRVQDQRLRALTKANAANAAKIANRINSGADAAAK